MISCLSVHLSVTLVDCDHMRWNSSKIISRLISLTLLLSADPNITDLLLPFLEIGGLQLSYPLLSQEQVKLRTSNLANTFKGPTRIKTH